MDGLWSEIKTWYKSPFSENMSVGDWFAFVGLIIFIVYGWNIILSYIARDA